jgi:hypothetical protein
VRDDVRGDDQARLTVLVGELHAQVAAESGLVHGQALGLGGDRGAGRVHAERRATVVAEPLQQGAVVAADLGDALLGLLQMAVHRPLGEVLEVRGR